MLIILGFQKGIRVVFGIGFLGGWASIGLGDNIWSNTANGDNLINLVESVCLFIGAGLVGIIKFFTASFSPFSVGMGIGFFILFTLNLYMAFKIDILIEADFV